MTHHAKLNTICTTKEGGFNYVYSHFLKIRIRKKVTNCSCTNVRWLSNTTHSTNFGTWKKKKERKKTEVAEHRHLEKDERIALVSSFSRRERKMLSHHMFNSISAPMANLWPSEWFYPKSFASFHVMQMASEVKMKCKFRKYVGYVSETILFRQEFSTSKKRNVEPFTKNFVISVVHLDNRPAEIQMDTLDVQEHSAQSSNHNEVTSTLSKYTFFILLHLSS
jgi:hypothetical protein